MISWEMLNIPLNHMDHWHWWIMAVVLIILELLSPAFFFLWLGIAAGIVGGMVLLFPSMGWKGQWLWFASLSIISLAVWHRMLKKRPTVSDRPTLNRRSSQYIGRTFTLSEPIVDGMGRIRVDDSSWRVSGEDAPLGTKVRVIGVDGTELQVALLSDLDLNSAMPGGNQ